MQDKQIWTLVIFPAGEKESTQERCRARTNDSVEEEIFSGRVTEHKTHPPPLLVLAALVNEFAVIVSLGTEPVLYSSKQAHS